MSSILYIDYLGHRGHNNFNKIYINAFDKDVDVKYVLRKGIRLQLGIPREKMLWEIPNNLFSAGKVLHIVFKIIMLCYIKFFLKVRKYDHVVVSCYETISLFFVPFPKGTYIINHNNISQLSQKIRRYCFVKMAKRYINIVFDRHSKEYLNSMGVKNVIISPHGIIDPYKATANESNTNDKYNLVVFSPSYASMNEQLFEAMLNSEELSKFLENNNILLRIKYNKLIDTKTKNLEIINGYMSKDEYVSSFLNADIILVLYSSSFVYRSSGVLFEAIANGKKILASNIKAFKEYEDFLKDDIKYCDSVESLIQGIDYFLSTKNNPISYTVDDHCRPSWNLIFRGIDNCLV